MTAAKSTGILTTQIRRAAQNRPTTGKLFNARKSPARQLGSFRKNHPHLAATIRPAPQNPLIGFVSQNPPAPAKTNRPKSHNLSRCPTPTRQLGPFRKNHPHLALPTSRSAPQNPLIGFVSQNPPGPAETNRVTDVESHIISATLGDISAHNNSHSRVLDVGLRVGSPKLDNYHLIGGAAPQYSAEVVVPIDGGTAALKQLACIETHRAYRCPLA